MKWIGLTGGIATGKSTVSQLLRTRGVPLIDADQVVHEIQAPGAEAYQAIVDHFDKGILNNDGTINRRALGGIVFSDPTQLKALESILHPIIYQKVEEKRRDLEALGHKMAVYDVPLLYEKHLEPRFDDCVLVYAPKALQVQRMKKRDQLSDEEIEKRLSQQLSIEEKKKRADFVIENSGSLEDLEKAVDTWLKNYQDQL